MLTLCPPGPLDRNTSTCRSLSSSWTSTSSASGSTSTVAEDVCTRPWLSVTGTRCTRCGPPSYLKRGQARFAADEEGDLVEPAEIARIRRQRLDLQAVAGGVRLVHLVQVAGEQVGLLATLGAPDLDDHVAPGVGIGRHEQQPQLRLHGVERTAGGGQLGFQRGTFVLGGDGQQLARRPAVGDERPPAAGGVDERTELVVTGRDPAQLVGIGAHGRVGEPLLQLAVLPLEGVEPIDDGRGVPERRRRAGRGRIRTRQDEATGRPWSPARSP